MIYINFRKYRRNYDFSYLGNKICYMERLWIDILYDFLYNQNKILFNLNEVTKYIYKICFIR